MAAFKNLTNSINLVIITEIILVGVAIVIIVIVVGIIPFRIVNQPEPMVCHFKKQVANSEIEVAVNVNLLVICRKLFKYNSKRHINQHITYSSEIPEKVAIVTIIPVVVMYKYIGFV